MGAVHSLVIRPKKKEDPLPVKEIKILKSGIQGDHHFKSAWRRTVTLISNDSLAEVAAVIGF